jgi:hypothetical protein
MQTKITRILVVISFLSGIGVLALIKDTQSISLLAQSQQFVNDLCMARLLSMVMQQPYRVEINTQGYRVLTNTGKQLLYLSNGSLAAVNFQTGRIQGFPTKYISFDKHGVPYLANSLHDNLGNKVAANLYCSLKSGNLSGPKIVIPYTTGYAMVE